MSKHLVVNAQNKIISLFKSGMPVRRIYDKTGISTGVIERILASSGIEKTEGGIFLKNKLKREKSELRRLNRLNDKTFKKYGLTYDELVSCGFRPSRKACSLSLKFKCNNPMTDSYGLLPVSQFHRSENLRTPQNPEGYVPQCATCDTERTTTWFKKNPTRANAIASTWRTKHPEKAKQVLIDFLKRFPFAIREQTWRKQNIRNLDGSFFVAADWKQKLKTAKGKCESCGKKSKLGIDHNHETDFARGILCNICNLALGKIELLIKKGSRKLPKLKHLDSMLAYLRKYPY